MRKLLLAFMFSILIISCISALEFDNVLRTVNNNAKYPELTIVNAFGLGSEIARMELVENTEQCLIDCYSIYKVTLIQDDVLPLNFDFKSKEGNMKSLNHKVYLQTIDSKDVIVPHYKEECSLQTNSNGTQVNICNSINDYNTTEERITYDWQKYKGTIMKAGTYLMKIEGKKGIKDSVDWGFSYLGISSNQVREYWAWWDSNWVYKKEITISGNIPNNYTMELNVLKENGMKSDYGDLRFLDGAEINELKYWIEGYNTTSAKVNVRLNKNSTIYMYYGNAGTSTTGDFMNTFVIADDFNDNSYNTTKWTTYSTSTCTISESGGSLDLVSANGGSRCFAYGDEFLVNINHTIKYNMTYTIPAEQFLIGTTDFAFGADPLGVCMDGQYLYIGDSVGYNWRVDNNGCGDKQEIALASGDLTGTQKHKLSHIENTTYWGEYYKNDTFYRNSSKTLSANTQMRMFLGGNPNQHEYIDWIALIPYSETSATFGAEQSNTVIIVTSSYPIDNYNSSSRTINFGCNLTSAGENITSVVLNTSTWTQSITGLNTNSYNATFTNTTIADGSYTWNCIGYGSDGINGSSTTRTFNVDATYPTISITSPTGNLGVKSIPYNVSLNYSATDTNLGSCWYNSTFNSTITTLASCANATVSVSGTELTQTIYVYVNDTFGNQNVSSTSYYLPLVINDVDYNINTTEYFTESFTINVTTNTSLYSSISSKLIYEDINYTGTLTSSDSDALGFSRSIGIPGGVGINSFYWQLTFTYINGSSLIVNSNIYNQTISPINFLICNSTTNVTFINFITKSIDTKEEVNSTLKTSWKLWIDDPTSYKEVNYSDTTNTKSVFPFCLTPPYQNYSANIILQYQSPGYAQNYYYILNASLTNQTQNITLYLLNSDNSTLTTIETLDSATFPLSDIYTYIQQYDVGTDSYYTVSMTKSDHAGKDISYLYWYNTLYKLVFFQNTTLIESTQPFKIASTTQTFRLLGSVAEDYQKFNNIVYTLTFNNATGNVVLTFTNPSSLITSGCLRVLKQTASNETTICDVCESSSSATVYCNINAYGNGTYVGQFYALGSWSSIETQTWTVGSSRILYDELGNDTATFYAFILSGLVMVFFFISPILGIIGLILGLLLTMILGFSNMSMATFITITIGGIVVIWIIKR